MYRTPIRWMLGQTILAVLLVGVALPAFGADDAQGTRIEITQVVLQAEADMERILNRFTYQAIQAATLEELVTAHGAATDEVTTVRDAALGEVDALVAIFPDALASDAANAQRHILGAAHSAYAEIDDIAAQVAPSLRPIPTTTTTVPPTTTTVTSSTSTTLAPSTTTTVEVTTTTVMAAPPARPEPPDQPPDIDEAVVFTLTQPPRIEPSIDEFRPVSGPTPTDSDLVTGAFATTMSVVMPPSIATAVLSVPIVIEILLGTMASSIRALIPPILILLIVGGAMVGKETGFSPRRRSASQPPM